MEKSGKKAGKNSKNSTQNVKITSAYDEEEARRLQYETQRTLMKTFELFYEQESEIMIAALEESREEIKNSVLELVDEQDKHKEALCKASEGKYNFRRKKENAIPLSDYLKKKRGIEVNTTVFNDGQVTQQHASDKEAVIKYLRKKERQKAAEDNKTNREVTEQTIENETQQLLEKLNDFGIYKDKDRERQMQKIQSKLKTKPEEAVKDNHQVATEIIENYQVTKAAYERDKFSQQQKFQARLSAAKERRMPLSGRDLTDMDSYKGNTFSHIDI